MSSDPTSEEFRRRRAALKARIDPLDRDLEPDLEGRRAFFDTVYDMAGGDAAAVPWADMRPKDKLAEWLAANPGEGRRAIDIACGLGDNAEAMAAAGYDTVAFDLAGKAIDWAKKRFPDSPVDYRTASLTEPPSEWLGAFDLVHECYTIQSVPPEMHERFSRAAADLVKPGGTLLIYARKRAEDAPADGPPWPLKPSETAIFADFGFTPLRCEDFEIVRPDRRIAHEFAVWKKAG